MKVRPVLLMLFTAVLAWIGLLADTPGVNAAQDATIDTITVTAEKRSQDSQTVPSSMTTLTGTQMEEGGIGSTMELLYAIPNLHAPDAGNHYGSQWLNIRGLSSTGSLSSGQAVGFYVDNVYYPAGVSTELFDVERIELLRGPQGTLYGRNTQAGVLNVVTRDPGTNTGGYAELSYGGFNTRRADFALGGPLSGEALSCRISGRVLRSDGHIENRHTGNDAANNLDDASGRVKFLWQPSPGLDIRLASEVMQYRDGFTGFTDLDSALSDPGRVNMDYEGSSDHDAHTHSLTLDYEAPGFNLVSISSFRNWESLTLMDLDYTPRDYTRGEFDNRIRTLNQEIRLVSKKATGLKWLVGVSLFDEKRDLGTVYDYRQGIAAYMIPPFKQIQDSTIDARGWALFGQATHTFLDRLDLTLGLRYDHEETRLEFSETYDQDLAVFGFSPSRVTPSAKTCDELLPKVSLAYRATAELMPYAGVSRGYTAGGYNVYVGQAGNAGSDFDPQYSWNYELGVKSLWLDRKLQFNAAVFWVDWKDQHVVQTTSSGDILFDNAAQSTSKGFELELVARPVAGLEILGGLGFTRVEFEEYRDNGHDYSGKTNPFVPDWTYNLAARYIHSSGLMARCGLTGIGGTYLDLDNTTRLAGYTLVDAGLGYLGDTMSLTLWAKNLGDKAYVSRAFESAPGSFMGYAGKGRTLGITCRLEF